MGTKQAIVRGISDSFQQATVQVPSSAPIDLGLARQQHAAYLSALRSAGAAVIELPPQHDLPDACFVEDCAIQADGTALIARPGAPSRSGEVSTVRDSLARWMRTTAMLAPATLDGGDCLRIGKTWFVGRSARTNGLGVKQVAAAFEPLGYRVVEVPVGEVLHLKCVCSRLDETRLLLAAGTIPKHLFSGLEILEIPTSESYAANAVSLNGTVLVADGYPETRRIVSEAGFEVVTLDVSEIRKADGSLTCLSILLDSIRSDR